MAVLARPVQWVNLADVRLRVEQYTLGPEIVLESEVKAGRLVQVLTQYQGPARPMHIVYPPTRRPTAKLRSFVDAMVAEFGH